MARKFRHIDSRETTGELFERAASIAMRQFVSYGVAHKNHIGDELDRKEGCDLELNGVRIDFTHNFSHKDNMHTLHKEFETPYGNIRIGVRFGNSHNGYTGFAKPVLVVGMDLTSYEVKTYMDLIVPYLTKHTFDIIHIGRKLYSQLGIC